MNWLLDPIRRDVKLLQYEVNRLDAAFKALDADAEQMETDLLKRIEELEQRLNHGSLKSEEESQPQEPQIARMRWSDRKKERIRRSGDMEFMKRKIQKVTEGSDAKV
jgi:predicted component of type VI protein secretion system